MVGGWKGGISRTYSYRLKKDMPKVCSSCGERPCEHCGRGPKLVLHHIDENPRNNDPSNLTILCGRCHHLVHGKQFYLSSPALSGRKK